MDTFWVIILGLVQGLTEFLPVSSSGHLAAGQMVFERSSLLESITTPPLMLEILLHLATLLAVVVFYRRDVLEGIKGAYKGILSLPTGRFLDLAKTDDGVNLAAAVLVGTIPTGIAGLLLRDPAGVVSRSPVGLGLSFIGCACLLFASRWWPGGSKRLSLRHALLIGIVQGIAVLPGISRSGSTIAVALALGLNREEAARFSFLLSLPAIAGAAILELDLEKITYSETLLAFALSFATAFAVGLMALFLLVRLVRGGRLWLFSPYVALIGLLLILFFL